ncbi:MAG: divergent polysaccharide deacetylase family protein [Holosporaceae bacterium]|jgi:polysaccharide deacetylase 2 family uncharacterized protein YibQ|nr:divergent polysaccharide deacetylase family protein [Holosporaceae bacterium]
MKNKKLILAWSVFVIFVIAFLLLTKFYHDDRKVPSSGYQYRIFINKDELRDIDVEEIEVEGEKEKKTSESVSDSVSGSVSTTATDPAPGSVPKNDDDLFYEQTTYGLLPKISADGDRVFDAYAAKFLDTGKKKACLVIYVDTGSVEYLPHAIKILGTSRATFIVPHYLDNVSSLVKMIHDAGHEIFLQIPTQASTTANQKNEIAPFLANSNTEDTVDKLMHLLAVSKYVIGIANTLPTLLTKSQKDITVILEELAKKGLAFLDLEKTNDVLQALSSDVGVIHANASVVFDAKSVLEVSDDSDGKIFLIHLDKLPDFLAAMAKWENYVIAPISAVIKKHD